jgi:hypothetical protein
MRPRRARTRPDLPAGAVDWLRGGDGRADCWVYFMSLAALPAFWREHSEAIVAEHVAKHPGTRPLRWWEYSAPGPRQRLGGIGTPCSEVLAHAPRFALGVPVDWVSESDIETWPHLRTKAKPIDPNDPPTFESQASYLKRLGLLLPGEARRLRPRDFEPDAVE